MRNLALFPPPPPGRFAWPPAFWPRLLRRRGTPPQVTHAASFDHVLGTSLDLRIEAGQAGQAQAAQSALLAEIERLEGVYSRFRPDSELNAWQAGPHEDMSVSADLFGLLSDALTWQRRTSGAFNPAADALWQVWRDAERAGTLPAPATLVASVAAAQPEGYVLSGRKARRCGAATLNFNAIAKGRVVDAAVRAASEVPGVRGVLVNIGGDLRHAGDTPVRVGIADPQTSAVNAPPVAALRVRNQAVATSGDTHRGFLVGGKRYSHVLDPRSGQPVTQVKAVSVLADDAQTADVLATAFSVLTPAQSLTLADQQPRVGFLIVTGDGQALTNAFWRQHAIKT